MADPNAVWDAVKTGGGLVLGGILTAFAKNFFTGAGAQEKELRSGLSERVAALEMKVEHLETRLDLTSRERDSMRFQRDMARIQRDTHRAEINAYQKQLGEPVTVWPADPPDTPGGAAPL
ncbi:hypothetical protein [Deinococcus ruber]|uniref:Uncharacterized protein n=1 Tax=Deinococcus ruber TaxID=1848197 RepID=A0A918CF73_9DEIO|nr:hypothetical protein [Deinococcus ruber]GGR18988.1 hypothetical protein GCM10008957_34570 [Deinococcus ruber]